MQSTDIPTTKWNFLHFENTETICILQFFHVTYVAAHKLKDFFPLFFVREMKIFHSTQKGFLNKPFAREIKIMKISNVNQSLQQGISGQKFFSATKLTC